MFKTSGCLIWQLDDCWPVISWSLIDYGINPKAAYFYVKRVYQPVIAPIIVRKDKVEVYVVNETGEPLDSELKFDVLTFTGEALSSQTIKYAVDAYTSNLVINEELENLPIQKNCILTATLMQAGKLLAEDVRTIAEPKNLKLPSHQIQASAKKLSAKTFELTLQSPVFVKAVKIDAADLNVKFGDNFFDLVPNWAKVVQCQLEKDLSVSAFNKTIGFQAYPYTDVTTSLSQPESL